MTPSWQSAGLGEERAFVLLSKKPAVKYIQGPLAKNIHLKILEGKGIESAS